MEISKLFLIQNTDVKTIITTTIRQTDNKELSVELLVRPISKVNK